MSLVIVGSIGLDTIETPVGKVTDALGGSAVYGAIAASYFTKAFTVGVVGSDFPTEHIELLKKHDIGIDGLEIREGSTFRWAGKYENWNQAQTLDTQLNVFGDFNPVLPEKLPMLQQSSFGQHPSRFAVKGAGPDKVLQDCRRRYHELLDKRSQGAAERSGQTVDIIFINEDELKLYTGEKSVYTAADKVLAMGPKLLVLKRGEYGSVLIGEEMLFFCPAYPVVEVRDPTGAGDSFAGGFMGYLAQAGEMSPANLKEACLYGTVMAALNVSEFSVIKLANHSFEHIALMQEELKKWMKI
jgi:sugar/nucleoside kinase (ribokinase family)